jgi:hypothetical protein
MRSGFRCFNWTDGAELPQSGCFYGNATYTPTGTISEIANETFGVEYGAGIASGVMAYEDITLAGITVTGQKVGIANSSSPNGDGVYSGILGLAYPALTSAHPGTNVSNTTFFFDRLPYNPLLYNMHQRGLIDPYFSLVLARTPQNSSSGFGGYLTLGNLPPVKYSNTFARAPVEVTEVLPLNFTSNQRVLSYWSTTISGVVYGPGPNNTTAPSAPQPNNITTSSTITNGTSFHALFDSGVTSVYLPTSIVSAVNALFLPPAIFDSSSGAYVVDCTAIPPQFGLVIDNQTFFLDGRDLIYQTAAPSTEEALCVSSLVSSDLASPAEGVVLNIIGAPFMKNVVSVFDFGVDEMRFARLEGEVTENESQHGSGSGGDGGSGNGTATATSNNGNLSPKTIGSLGYALSLAVLASVVFGAL